MVARPLLPSLLFLAAASSAQTPLFEEVHWMIPPDFYPFAFADLDGDGDLDAANSGRFWENDGQGRFTERPESLPPAPFLHWPVAVFDVDGDGDQDAVRLREYGGFRDEDFFTRVEVWLAQGNFRFTLGRKVDLPGRAPLVMRSGDVDGDGDLDLLLGGETPRYPPVGHVLHLLRNDGSGTFERDAGSIRSERLDTRDFQLADVDGDLDLDLILANGSNAPHARDGILINDGTGLFTLDPARLPAPDSPSTYTAVGDIDGDGDLDLVFAHGRVGLGVQNRLYRNDGTGHFVDSTLDLPSRLDPTWRIELADLEGDSDLDLFVSNGSIGITAWDVQVLRNDGTGRFAPVSPFLEPVPGPGLLWVEDLDGDSDVDVLFRRETNDDPELYLNDGRGNLHAVGSERPAFDECMHLAALGDLDGDRAPDLVLAGRNREVRLLFGDGAGRFRVQTHLHPRFVGDASAIALADLDGDSHLDLLVGYGDYGPVVDRLYLNNGFGVFFEAPSRWNGPVAETTCLAVFDVDGDGDRDVVSGARNEPPRLALNDGTGSFHHVSGRLPQAPLRTLALTPIDVDGDGALDLYVGVDGEDRLWRNDGTGHFTDDPTALVPDTSESSLVRAGDVDGDGDLDLVIDGLRRHKPLLLRNDGWGRFREDRDAFRGNLDTGAQHVSTLADLDDDGDLDLVTMRTNRLQYLVNDGTGHFDLEPSLGPRIVPRAIAMSSPDVDLDQDRDLLLLRCFLPPILLRNRTRQLSWESLPRLGRFTTLRVDGPPNAGFLLLGATSTAHRALPPYGAFLLDPNTTSPLIAGSIALSGRFSQSVLLPNAPALLGRSVYLQALIDGPPRFTNLEILRVRDL